MSFMLCFAVHDVVNCIDFNVLVNSGSLLHKLLASSNRLRYFFLFSFRLKSKYLLTGS